MTKNFTEIKPLCYWVQHILPLVYDDSLSYMELLARTIKRLNELIENNNKLPDYIAELIKEYISSGEIEKVLAEVLANYMLNVKFPPAGLTPATGDGTADDTEAIQGCIDYAFNNGGMAVYFPSGSYLVQSLTLRNKSTLFGNDRYTTLLVLKGGATAPLFVGNVDELTLTGLGFDGNMDIQVNNVDLIDLTVNSAIITNLLLTDGYDLLKITVNNDLQLNDVIFNHAVTNALVSSGNGYVQGCNLIFKTVSALVGENFVILNNNNSILEELKFEGASPKGITVNGNNNVIKLWSSDNIVNAYIDNGDNNSFSVYTKSESQKLSGSKWNIIGGFYHETIAGNKEVTAADSLETVNSKTENISGTKNVNSKSSNETVTNGKKLTAETLTENVDVKTVTADSSTENLRTKTETLTEDKTVNARNSNENLTGNKDVNVQGSVEETIDGTLTESNAGHTETITGNDTKTVTGKVSETSQNKEVTANNSYIERGFNKTETFTGAKNETLGSSQETITGDKVVTAANSTETVQGDKTLNTGDYAETVTGNKTVKVTEDITEEVDGNKNENIGVKGVVNAPDYQLNITNHLTYENPQRLNELFNYITMKNPQGQEYKVLVDKGATFAKDSASQSAFYADAMATSVLGTEKFKRWASKNPSERKICFIGNSITEGSNNYLENIFPQKFANELSKYTAYNQVNYSLGGNNIYNFYSDTFTAVPGTPEGDPNHFWRNWATNGKTWKQCALDYDADIYICSFGMNSNLGYRTGENMYTHVTAITDYLRSKGAAVVWIADVMPAIDMYSSTEGLRAGAMAMRIACLKKNAPFMNANRLSNILLYGQDTLTYKIKTYNKLPEGATAFSLFGQMNFTFTDLPSGEDNAIEIWFKYTTDGGGVNGLLLRFYTESETPTIKAYSLQNTTPTELGTSTFSGLTTSVRLEGTNLFIGSKVITDFKDLGAGTFYMPANREKVASFFWISQEYASFDSGFDNETIYPPEDTTYNGSHINHPSPLGHELFYFAPLRNIISMILNSRYNEYPTTYVSPVNGGYGVPQPTPIGGTTPKSGIVYTTSEPTFLSSEQLKLIQAGTSGNNLTYFFTQDETLKGVLQGNTLQLLF